MDNASPLDRRDTSIMTSLLAIVLLLAALVFSLELIPSDFQEPGALFWPALLLSAALLIVPMSRIKFDDVRTALRVENFVLLGLIYWVLLDLLQTSYPLTSASVSDVETAFCAIILMAVGLWTGLAMQPWRLPRPLVHALTLQLSPPDIFSAILVCFALGTFYYFYESSFAFEAIVSGLLGGRWSAPWARGQFGDWNAIIEHMTYFGYILPSLTVILALTLPPPHWARVSVIISIVLSIIFLAFLVQSGSRRTVGVVIGGALLTWIGMRPQINFKQMILAASAVVILLIVLQEILYVRRFGLEAAFEGRISESDKVSYIHVDDNFLRLTQLINLIPERFDYVGYQPFLYVLTRPIPRVLWPDKPSDPGYDLPSMISLKGARGTSLSSSIVGELYASWGLIAVFLGGLFFGKIAGMWNVILSRGYSTNSRAIYGLGIMVLFAGIRSMQDLLLMTYGVLGWILLSALFRRLRRRVAASPSKNR